MYTACEFSKVDTKIGTKIFEDKFFYKPYKLYHVSGNSSKTDPGLPY